MTVLVDTSIVIDVLRGSDAAALVLQEARRAGPLHASELTRLEVLAGMRSGEAVATRALLDVFTWHPFDATLAELAGELGRAWLPGNRGIDTADLAIAATAVALGVRLLTRNVKHFPMFAGLAAPY
ncbi:type II toxin-antitoxin system VapC family toxin [Homoserinibacter sp. GY 40078]|uniref:type II toxin-antitoxin system VapC family toxin n=1 Tax=Homoserinibacter sp. GY 40078 TaxID=2603275 RepID=UPI0011CBBB0D|nr:type II toxin-antitoxin system VapC family toxin [Homoserinibacter sp. GY 40078]TXK17085.1 type II toxin-antitoxin system VapC family toxin [Homoserinibacter sp. GY 40078]